MKHISRFLIILALLFALLFFRLPAAQAAPGGAKRSPAVELKALPMPASDGPTGGAAPANPVIPHVATDDFVITIKTDNPGSSGPNQFTIPTTGVGYDYNVNCDDSGPFEGSGVNGDFTCTYATAGTYTLRIQDNSGSGTGFPRIFFNLGGDAQKLLTIQQWGKGHWTSMNAAFSGCSNLTVPASDAPDLSGVTDMAEMFFNASAFNQPIGSWITSHVTDMNSMFYGDSLFNQPIGTWNTSQVTDMAGMFYNASAFNQPIGGWDTSQVTSMGDLFYGDNAFNQDIHSWNTGNVTDMESMFFGASVFNQDIHIWNTGNVTNMSEMFAYASAFNQNIGNWNTSKVTEMYGMFYQAVAFNQNIGGWSVAALTDAGNMFSGVRLSTPNYDALLTGWDGQSLQTGVDFSGGNSDYCNGGPARAHMAGTDGWFITDGGRDCPADDFVITVKTDNPGSSGASQFKIPTTGSGYDYNVDCDDNGIFDAAALGGDFTCIYGAPGVYTIRIQDNSGTEVGFPRIYFDNSGDIQKLLAVQQWGKGHWTSMNAAFYGCSNLTVPASDAPDLSGVTDMASMFHGASAFNQPIGSWDTGNVTNMEDMFYYASAFNQPIGGWNTGQVTDMDGLFYYATAFNQPIGSWITGNVTNMSFMFSHASAFNQPIGSWNTGSVAYMGSMFAGASAFNKNIAGWNTAKVTSMSYMFYQAGAFNQNLAGWNTAKVSGMSYMFSQAGAFDQNLGGWNVTALTNAGSMFGGVKLSTSNYDALLTGWNGQALQPGVTFDGGNSNYCTGGSARAHMIGTDGWSITDGGPLCKLSLPMILR